MLVSAQAKVGCMAHVTGRLQVALTAGPTCESLWLCRPPIGGEPGAGDRCPWLLWLGCSVWLGAELLPIALFMLETGVAAGLLASTGALWGCVARSMLQADLMSEMQLGVCSAMSDRLQPDCIWSCSHPGT